MCLKGSSIRYTSKQNHTDLLVSFLKYRREQRSVWLYIFFPSSIKRVYWQTYCSKIRHKDHWHDEKGDKYEKVLLQHHTSKHQYYAQWYFESGSIITIYIYRYDKLYHISLKWNNTILCILAWSINKIGLFELHCVLASLKL